MNKMQTFFKGLAMGAADVVPGVSGGTIAFITGIYDTLLESIRRINPRLIKIIKEQGIKQAFIHINGSFLIILLSGILTSIFSFAEIITWMLSTHPIILWSFFFGLILMSVIHMLKKITRWDMTRFITLFSGIFFAYAIIVLHPINMEPTSLNMFFAGSIAICAMILPGISGSFILLILGMYAPLLVAAKSFDVFTLAVFSLGCLIGLLSFSHLLSWLLLKYRDITLTFLSGLMIGTFDKIWPWKQVLSWRINSKGEEVALLERNLSPFVFEQLTNTPSLMIFALAAATLGFLTVLCVEKFSEEKN